MLGKLTAKPEPELQTFFANPKKVLRVKIRARLSITTSINFARLR